MNSYLSGADDSIEKVIEKYSATVYGIALTHTKNKCDADDVYQNVFLTYFKKNKRFESEEHRKAYIINITLKCVKKVNFSTWNKKTVALDERKDVAFAFSSREENSVFIAIKELPEKYRTVIHLFYFENLPTSKISEILRIKEPAVRMRLVRAREMLRNKLKGEYFYERK